MSAFQVTCEFCKDTFQFRAEDVIGSAQQQQNLIERGA